MANIENLRCATTAALANELLVEEMTCEMATLIASRKNADPKLFTMALFRLGRTVHALESCAENWDNPTMAFVYAKIQEKLGNYDAARDVLDTVMGKQDGAMERRTAIPVSHPQWCVPTAYEELTDLSPTSKRLIFYCGRTGEPWTNDIVRVRFVKNHIDLEIRFTPDAFYSKSYFHNWAIDSERTIVVVHSYQVEVMIVIREKP